jgi:CRP-like cAMP-binding protein
MVDEPVRQRFRCGLPLPNRLQPMLAIPDPKENRLLAALAGADLQRWLMQLELVELQSGQVLYEPDNALRHAYFPTTAVVSLMSMMNGTPSSELAIVGNEGMVGIAFFMAGETAVGRAVVQSAGHAFRLPVQAAKDELHRGGPTLHMLLRYAQARMTQVSQATVCARHHLLEQRLCSWLLQNFDRLPSNELTMTHEKIAKALGMRREGVTEKAQQLQAAGLIRYFRGHVELLDRTGLETRACECYESVRGEYRRLLPETDSVSSGQSI